MQRQHPSTLSRAGGAGWRQRNVCPFSYFEFLPIEITWAGQNSFGFDEALSSMQRLAGPFGPTVWQRSAQQNVTAAHVDTRSGPPLSPLHPAHPSGHATVAGACSVVL